MTQLVVEYGPDATQATVTTVEELDTMLDRLEAEAAADVRPWWIYLYDFDGATLRTYMSIGLGGPFSFLTWADEVANTGAHSTGDLDNGEVTAWLYSGSYSELKPGRAISKEAAREAVREYLRTGQQPTAVAWAA